MRKAGLRLKLENGFTRELAVVAEIHHVAKLAAIPRRAVQFRTQRKEK
jgi:hypothetical protein